MPPKKSTVEPVKDEAQVDLIGRGEDAKKLLSDTYFTGLLERMDETYKGELLSLHPAKADRFTAIQERRQGLIDLRGSIIGDAEAGRKELAKMQGETKQSRMA